MGTTFLRLLLAVGILGTVLHAQAAIKSTDERANAMTRKIVRALYPEIDLSSIKLHINVDSIGLKAYRFGVILESVQDVPAIRSEKGPIPTIKLSREPQQLLRLSVAVGDDEVPLSILASGEYVNHQQWEDARRELAFHPEWNGGEIVRMLKSRGAHFAPPRVPPSAGIAKRLKIFFPGLRLRTQGFESRVNDEPSQPWLLWECASIPAKGRDDVLVRFEPFTGRVHSVSVVNRPPI